MTTPLIRLFSEEDDAVCRGIASRAAMSAYGPKMRAAEKVADETAPLEDAELRLVAEIDGRVVGFAASNAGARAAGPSLRACYSSPWQLW